MNKKTSTNFVEVFYLYTIVRIKDWNRGERPREKMMEQGVRSLSESELLAILINSGTRDMSAVELGRKILAFLFSAKFGKQTKKVPSRGVRG